MYSFVQSMQFAHCILWCACVLLTDRIGHRSSSSSRKPQQLLHNLASIGIPCIYFHQMVKEEKRSKQQWRTKRNTVYVLKAALSNFISTQTPKQCYFRFSCKTFWHFNWLACFFDASCVPIFFSLLSFYLSFFSFRRVRFASFFLFQIFLLVQVVKYFTFGLWHTLPSNIFYDNGTVFFSLCFSLHTWHTVWIHTFTSTHLHKHIYRHGVRPEHTVRVSHMRRTRAHSRTHSYINPYRSSQSQWEYGEKSTTTTSTASTARANGIMIKPLQNGWDKELPVYIFSWGKTLEMRANRKIKKKNQKQEEEAVVEKYT